jgi:hypothetical protein
VEEAFSGAFATGMEEPSFLTGMWLGVEAACCLGSRSGPSHRNPPFDPKLGILSHFHESTPTNRSRAHDSIDDYTPAFVAPSVFRLFPEPLYACNELPVGNGV